MTTTSLPVSGSESRLADWLTREEIAIVEAVCDTLLPSLDPPVETSDVLKAYYQRRASDLHVAQKIAETLGRESREVQAELHLFLRLFTAPPMGLLFAGSAKPFIDLPQDKRERYLLALANSPIGVFRQGFQGFKRLAGLIYYSTLNEEGINPNWEAVGYTPPPATPPAIPPTIKPFTLSQERVLEADVVVVGSGAGGGVVAGELAMAGKNVIVLEKGGYNHEGTFTQQEGQTMTDLFLKHGALSTKDLGVIMMAGSTLGGGTAVNWMTSFRTPENILEEWEQISGLKGQFTASDLQHSFASVEQRSSVNANNSQHNGQNQRLFDGASALGYQAGIVRRNAIGCEQRCGACNFGCRYGCNQSTMKTYLQDAYDHGARIMVHTSVEKVLLQNGRAIGVQAVIDDPISGNRQKVIVHAKTVVLAAGALYSPTILLQSGIENKHIGQHLHLHPTAISVGVYPEKIQAWQGVLQSAYSKQFAHLDGNYGYTVEVAPAHPGLFGLATPWYSARDYREQMTTIDRLASFIILTRDRGEGSVSVNSMGDPVIKYAVSPYDRKHILHGLQQGTRMHFAAGADEVISLQNKPTSLKRPAQGSLQPLREFDRLIARRGLNANRIVMFTAHQMGTCRMGASPETAVIDQHHQVYGVKGLFICDSSVFPSASGVNPMLSIMALAHKASQYMKSEA